jgi:ATP-dependent Lon protease
VVRLTLATTLDFARAHWPHLSADSNNYAYSLKIAKEDEPSSGSSAGLPVALAFLSLILGRRVPPDLAASGSMVSDSQRHVVLRRVGDAPHKTKGAYHRNLSMLLLPEENRPDVECGDVVPLTVARDLVRYAADLSEAIEIIWGREVWET